MNRWITDYTHKWIDEQPIRRINAKMNRWLGV